MFVLSYSRDEFDIQLLIYVGDKYIFSKMSFGLFYTICTITQVAPLNTFLLDGVVTEYLR